AVDAVELDHQEGEDRRHDEFPHAFNPQMDDVPPVELVEREIDRIVEGEEEEQRQPPQTEQKNVGYGGLAALERRQRDVEQEHQADNDDADLDDEWLFEKFTPLVNMEQVTDNGDTCGHEEQPELDDGKVGAVKLGFGFFRQKIIGRAHEAHQQPDDQRVGVDHADDVEGQKLGERVGQNIDRTGENTECDLRDEQDERSIEIEHRDLLAFIFHVV